jgi:chorismate mutase
LALWLGAVERLHDAGIKNLGVIHRGFSTYEKTKYRNNPEWQIAIDLQSEYPDLPIILDPSHIAGRRDIIFDICQTGLDLNFDGIMVETHFDPDNAWSDASQQITPKALDQMTVDLRIRKEFTEATAFQNKLQTLRTKIDVVDHQLIDLLGKRMKIADDIGNLKKKNNVAILQSKRWNSILDTMIAAGAENNLSKEFITKFLKAIHEESISHQHKIISE